MPGKGARTKRKLRRQAEKRARKQATKAQYEAWTKAGQNTKSKRARKQAKKKASIGDYKHPDGHCGNVACEKCYGFEWRLRPFLDKKGQPKPGMPQKYYFRWKKLQKED